MPVRRTNILALLFALFLMPALSQACSVMGISKNVDLVSSADAIIRAKAIAYATPPSDPNMWTTGVPDSKVRFKVIELIRGLEIPNLVLPGYLVQRDDFNDQQAPYTFVRPGGRAGSCFANSYRQDAEFLLFLKKTETRDLTVNWAALAPVNEQLHSPEDPWLIWVRQQAHKSRDSAKH